MAEERITISLWLKDRLTGPLDKLAAKMDKFNKADAQMARTAKLRSDVYTNRGKKIVKAAKETAYAYSQQKKIFEANAKAEHLYLNKRGRWMDKETKRFATREKMAKIHLETEKQLANLSGRQKFTDRMTKLTATLTGGAKAAERLQERAGRLGKAFGVNEAASAAFGRTMSRTWSEIPNQVGRAADRIGHHMGRIMKHQSEVQTKMGNAYKWGLGVPAAGVAGYGLYEGMKRLNTFEGSDVRLGVLNFDQGQRDDIQKQVDEMVRGTIVTLPDGMGIATKLLGSNVDIKDFEDRMQTVVDTASVFAPHDIGGVATVFGQVTQKGFLTGEEAAQFNERLVPVIDMLAVDLGTDAATIRQMMEKRQITADMVWEAVGPAVEGGADAMGKTFLGAWSMLKSAIGRSGQYFLEGFSENLAKIIRDVTSFVDYLAPFFRTLGENLGGGMDEAVQRLPQLTAALAPLEGPIKDLFKAIGDNLPELVTGLALFIGIMARVAVPVLEVATALLKLAEPIMPVLVPAVLVLLHALAGFTILAGIVAGLGHLALGLWGFFKLLDKLGIKTEKFWKGIYKIRPSVMFKSFGAWIKNFFSRGASLIGKLWTLLGKGPGLLRALGFGLRLFPVALFLTGLYLLIDAFGVLYDNVDWVRKGIDGIVDAIRTAIGWFQGLIGMADDWLSKKFDLDNEGDVYEVNRQLDVRPQWWKDATEPMEKFLGVGRFGQSGEGLLHPFQGSEAHRGQTFAPTTGGLSGAFINWFRDILGVEGNPDAPKTAEDLEKGFAAGGYTGGSSPSAVTGYVHGQEYVTNAWATRSVEATHPGALAYINATGKLPATGGGGITYAPNVSLTVGAGTDTAAFTAIVRAELARQAREMRAAYMTPTLRGAR